MAEELNATPVIGGGRIYQRKPGGSWQFCLWVEGEGRIRRSLKTTDKGLALREAERLTLDAKAAQSAGHRVLAGTLAECLARYEEHQQERMDRGEIRSVDNARYKVRFLRRVLGELFGLERVISTLTQRDWDRFVPHRGRQGAALFTIRQECSLVRNFCKFSRHYGCQLVPELKVNVPKGRRSRRNETFTAVEFEAVKAALDRYVEPDTEDGTYEREWSLGSAKARATSPKVISQDLERSRRELLRWFVRLSSASGCRPHELAGGIEDSALRWRDIEIRKTQIEENRFAAVAIIRVREDTKTGRRSVPTTAGLMLGVMRKWSRFAGDDDYVFADQYGIRAGKPVYLDALRLHWRQVISRMRFTRFKPDLYTIRHFWATQRLLAGAPPVMVAKSLGHSLQELLSVYEHLLLEDEAVIRQVWKSNTPVSLQKQGIVVPDAIELEVGPLSL